MYSNSYLSSINLKKKNRISYGYKHSSNFKNKLNKYPLFNQLKY